MPSIPPPTNDSSTHSVCFHQLSSCRHFIHSDHLQQSPKRTNNAMSLSSILSDDAGPRGPPSPVSARKPASPLHVRQDSDKAMPPYAPSPASADTKTKTTESYAPKPAATNGAFKETNGDAMRGPSDLDARPPKPSSADKKKPEVPPPAPPSKPKVVIDDRKVALVKADLDRQERDGEWSEPDDADFMDEMRTYRDSQLKRKRETAVEDEQKRVRRRIAQTQKLAMTFAQRAEESKENFNRINEKAVADEIMAKSQAEEKEKKKIQQRNRRRELQKQRHEREVAEFNERAENAADPKEREKLIREAQKAEKKVTNTTKLLNGEIPNRDLREATPVPNYDGGIIGSFQISEDQADSSKKKQRTGEGRKKKSKEQKQAEKDAAAAAHAAMERGDELVSIAPKGDAARSVREDFSVGLESSPVERMPKTHDGSTKAFDLIYNEIMKDIARKVPKLLHQHKEKATAIRQSNLRKTAQLAAKEARRWQQKTNKAQKDTQARAKRGMREMLSFWKRNEREERDQRKLAEKTELENAKKAEADREANRQKRKLNFLISQTELYSHFIGKKVKTDEVERSTDDVAAGGAAVRPGDANAHTVNLPDVPSKTTGKVTNFEDLDFDAEDETALHEAAMANAQNAVQEAQDRARAFNTEGQVQSQFDDGEMNFQNPTSLQSMDIGQPKMLSCQLKEYQIKGLNWLVNLYEQGINGILADEMGLGKTVQSISVMAYLAEVHNIWGPFLVIAPASTLHNWQQEITRFVPDMTVLPYWGNAKDRKVLRKFWDRKHITYKKDAPFHVLVTSYQLVVQDTQYFQKMRWQYMILDEAQAIKSSQSSRWKSLLGFHCRNRLLLTGTPIQNNMQELWALLHFIMPSLFDSHDEFSDWFSKDIESHAQSNTKLNEDQLKRLHMILKPFMLRRIKKHVQKELGDKVEEDVYCDLTYRQRAYYSNLRNRISILDLIEKAAIGDDQDTATLMNLVMQFRKVCNHPDLFERAEFMSPVSFSSFAECASFMREGHFVDIGYSVRNLIEMKIPRLVGRDGGRLNIAGPDNEQAGWRYRFLNHQASIWQPEHSARSMSKGGGFSFLKFMNMSASDAFALARKDIFERSVDLRGGPPKLVKGSLLEEEDGSSRSFLRIDFKDRATTLHEAFQDGPLHELMNISSVSAEVRGLDKIEPAGRPAASAPPIELYCASQGAIRERQQTMFNVPIRRALYSMSEKTEQAFLDARVDPSAFPVTDMLPAPNSTKSRFTNIQCPSMRRFVTDSGKLATLDRLLSKLKEEGHRVLLYFQMTRMIDLMEEYLTYRNYRYCRLDGSTKLEDRRDTVADFQSQPDIFVFLLSTRAGGLGINLTAADTVIFYDSDWNPTIDSQAMDRAHRLGQTRQVTVYRLITRGTIEERIRRRALQKEEVQRVVISGGAGAQVDFNTRSRENRTKDIAMWLADDDQAAEIEKKEAEIMEKEAKEPNPKKRKAGGKRKELSLDDMYHEGEFLSCCGRGCASD